MDKRVAMCGYAEDSGSVADGLRKGTCGFLTQRSRQCRVSNFWDWFSVYVPVCRNFLLYRRICGVRTTNIPTSTFLSVSGGVLVFRCSCVFRQVGVGVL